MLRGLALALSVTAGSITLQPLEAEGQLAAPRGAQKELIDISGIKSLRSAQRFIVPTAFLYLSVEGMPDLLPPGFRAIGNATSEYRLLGLRRQFAEQLALEVQSELVARLRARQWNAQSHDDISGNALVTSLERLRTDMAFNAPVATTAPPRTTYAVVAPTAAQLFAGNTLKKHLAFKALARESGAVVVIPELWFLAPQSETVNALFAVQVRLTEGMSLVQAALTFIAPDGSSGSIIHKSIGTVTTFAGTLVDLGTESTSGSTSTVADTGALGRGLSLWEREQPKRGSNARINHWTLSVVEPGYRAGVLRGMSTFFGKAFEIIDRARR